MIRPFMLDIVMQSFFAELRRVPLGALHEATCPSMMLSFFGSLSESTELGGNRLLRSVLSCVAFAFRDPYLLLLFL